MRRWKFRMITEADRGIMETEYEPVLRIDTVFRIGASQRDARALVLLARQPEKILSPIARSKRFGNHPQFLTLGLVAISPSKAKHVRRETPPDIPPRRIRLTPLKKSVCQDIFYCQRPFGIRISISSEPEIVRHRQDNEFRCCIGFFQLSTPFANIKNPSHLPVNDEIITKAMRIELPDDGKFPIGSLCQNAFFLPLIITPLFSTTHGPSRHR